MTVQALRTLIAKGDYSGAVSKARPMLKGKDALVAARTICFALVRQKCVGDLDQFLTEQAALAPHLPFERALCDVAMNRDASWFLKENLASSPRVIALRSAILARQRSDAEAIFDVATLMDGRQGDSAAMGLLVPRYVELAARAPLSVPPASAPQAVHAYIAITNEAAGSTLHALQERYNVALYLASQLRYSDAFDATKQLLALLSQPPDSSEPRTRLYSSVMLLNRVCAALSGNTAVVKPDRADPHFEEVLSAIALIKLPVYVHDSVIACLHKFHAGLRSLQLSLSCDDAVDGDWKRYLAQTADFMQTLMPASPSQSCAVTPGASLLQSFAYFAKHAMLNPADLKRYKKSIWRLHHHLCITADSAHHDIPSFSQYQLAVSKTGIRNLGAESESVILFVVHSLYCLGRFKWVVAVLDALLDGLFKGRAASGDRLSCLLEKYRLAALNDLAVAGAISPDICLAEHPPSVGCMRSYPVQQAPRVARERKPLPAKWAKKPRKSVAKSARGHQGALVDKAEVSRIEPAKAGRQRRRR